MLNISVTLKQFDDKVVLQDLRFSVKDGELVALVGPSGCGKSTLVKLIAGLDDDYTGEISRPDGDGAIGCVFQSPRLLPWCSVLENVELAADGIEGKDILRAVGLSGEEGNYPSRMSGGMRRRLAIARAFAIDPGLLLLDEPFVSLDEPSAQELRALLLNLLSERKRTTVFITHNLREAVALTDRIVFLSASPASVIAELKPEGERGARTDQQIAAFLQILKDHPKEEIRELL